MKKIIYVILASSGGWSGTTVLYSICSRSFSTQEEAESYIRETRASNRGDLWDGEVFEVEVELK